MSLKLLSVYQERANDKILIGPDYLEWATEFRWQLFVLHKTITTIYLQKYRLHQISIEQFFFFVSYGHRKLRIFE